MKICILSTYRRFPFAQDLVMGALGTKGVLTSSMNEMTKRIMTKGALRMELENSDVVLVVIDKEFNENEVLSNRLRTIVSMIRRDSNKTLIPVILDDAKVPIILKKTACIECVSSSTNSIENTKMMLKKLTSDEQIIDIRRFTRKNKTFAMIILTLAIEGLAVSFFYLFYRDFKEGIGLDYFNDTIFSVFVPLVFATAITTLVTSYVYVMKRKWHEDNEEDIESYSRRLQRVIATDEGDFCKDNYTERDDANNEVVDALGRMLINLEDIKEFYTWSQRQAKQSFFLAVGLCIFGFALIVASVVLIVVLNSGYEVAIVSTIGGVTTELIAGTALVVYKNSLSQLNHYHKALHEDERFLSSVNLLGKFSTVEAQDDMLREIIRSEIQINLAGVNDRKGQNDDS